MNNTCLVSVIIPTYKRSDFLIRAITSVLNQKYKKIEIIVVDDNDSDSKYRHETKRMLIEEGLFNKVKYIEHDRNKGLSAARNTGVKLAVGEFVCFLDDDDEFFPNKIEQQVNKFLSLDKKVGMIYSGYEKYYVASRKVEYVTPKHRGDLSSLLGVNHIGPPSMVMCRRSVVLKLEGFDESFRSREDIEFYYRLSLNYEIDYQDDNLIRYYIHDSSLSRIFSDKLKYMLQFIDKHEDSLKKPRARWSELHERLGEWYMANGMTVEATQAFSVAYANNPFRIKIIIKMLLGFTGRNFYMKLRKL